MSLYKTGEVIDFNRQLHLFRKKTMRYAYDSCPVTEQQIKTIKEIREQFSFLSQFLNDNAPKGRYLSIVETKLEEAAMFAVKSITHAAGQYDINQSQVAPEPVQIPTV